MYKIYEKNLQFFNRVAPGIIKVLNEDNFIEHDIITIEGINNCIVSKDGDKCYVESIYNTDREIQEFMKNITPNTEILVVFGVGFGSIFKYLTSNNNKLKEIIIIEPGIKIFKEFLSKIDVEYIEKFKVTMLINKDEDAVINYLSSKIFNKYDICIIAHTYFRTIFSEYYKIVSQRLISRINSMEVQINTVRYQTYDWLSNCIRNLKQDVIPLESILKRIKETKVPVVVVSAGPSLNKNMHLLKEVNDRALIIAVGSAIRILHNNGIIPHLRMALDPAPHEREATIEGIDTSVCPIVFINTIYYKILDEYIGPKIRMIGNFDPVSMYIQKNKGKEIATISGGFSVSNVAFNLACEMESSKIIIMGQDMCYTDKKNYAKGSWLDEEIDIKEEGYIKAKDIYGNEVYTYSVFLGIKMQLEDRIKQNQSIHFINATEGGLGVDGAQNMSFKEVLEQLDSDINVKNILSDVINNKMYKEYGYELYDDVLKFENEIDIIIKLNTERIEKLKDINKHIRNNRNENKVFKEYSELNYYENNINEVPMYQKVIVYALHDILKMIRLSSKYDGDDKEKQLESIRRIVGGYSYEIKAYTDLIKTLIGEYKSEIESLKQKGSADNG